MTSPHPMTPEEYKEATKIAEKYATTAKSRDQLGYKFTTVCRALLHARAVALEEAAAALEIYAVDKCYTPQEKRMYRDAANCVRALASTEGE